MLKVKNGKDPPFLRSQVESMGRRVGMMEHRTMFVVLLHMNLKAIKRHWVLGTGDYSRLQVCTFLLFYCILVRHF